MSWIADLIQIAAGSNGFWMTVALLLLAYFGRQWYSAITAMKEDFVKLSKVLIREGVPIDIPVELSEVEKALLSAIEILGSQLTKAIEIEGILLTNQQRNSDENARFRREPWRLCGQFKDCPAVRDKNRHIDELGNLIIEEFKKHDTNVTRIMEKLNEIHLDVLENRKNEAIFIEQFGKQLLRIVELRAGITPSGESGVVP
jgi:hypothetical protein